MFSKHRIKSNNYNGTFGFILQLAYSIRSYSYYSVYKLQLKKGVITSYNIMSKAADNEMTPLVGGTWLVHSKSVLSKYSKKVFFTSKAAMVILLWNFAINSVYGLIFVPSGYIRIYDHIGLYLAGSFVIAIVLFFSPVAGFLADVKFGRYKTLQYSMWLILAVSSLAVFASLILFISMSGIQRLGVSFMITLAILYLLGHCGYNSNIIQYGLDQLRDAPSQDSILFIHWFFWSYSCSIFTTQGVYAAITYYYPIYSVTSEVILITSMVVLSIVILAISLSIADFKQRWFIVEPGGNNPYKLVYKVIRFACLHKIPVYRSAFAYCEDELPSRLDLGKSKYGGPFTTEQVEDVKVFLGILKVLLSSGPIFFINVAVTFLLSGHRHLEHYLHGRALVEYMLLDNGLLSTILIIVFLPLYLCILHPFISYHIPGMLKRIGTGFFLLCISLVSLIIVYTVTHGNIFVHDRSQLLCANTQIVDLNTSNVFSLITIHLIAQHTLSALFQMLVYISVWVFICCQSPHSMKGLIFGVFFAIQGLFRFTAVALFIFFHYFWNTTYLNCGTGYLLVNLAIGVIAFLAYVCVAKRYRYRMRDEPFHIHRYAEEYYSNNLH